METMQSTPELLQILRDIPVRLDLDQIKRKLHMEQRRDCRDLEDLVEAARPLIAGRAAFRLCYVDERHDDSVIIDRIQFTSKVLRKNLADIGRVFPFVVTIGSELEERGRGCGDLLQQFSLDVIANVALAEVRQHLQEILCARLALTGMSFMSPGSLTDWPIEQQRQLFALLGDVQKAIGVRLTDSLLMLPSKSLSGVFFPTEVPFLSCKLCPRRNCESRKAPCDEQAAKEYGVISSEH
jgi:hypothetical protein